MKKLLILLFGVLSSSAAFALIGDVNGDGIVNTGDVSAIFRCIITGDETLLANSDVNGDGFINTGDVSAVYDIIINGAPPEVTEYTVNGVTFKMVEVEGGTFSMGASIDDTQALADERPAHQVTVSSFAIGQTVVTQELWEAVMGSNPSLYEGAQLPVHSISWADCHTFIDALNSQLHIDGYKFRMPTEAEWEYAARGGKQSKGYMYSGSNNYDDVAWCHDNSDDVLHNVGTKAPNELGIYDMSGNISEWCLDWKGNYTAEAQDNPTGPETGTYRVARGGAYSNPQSISRVSSRPGYRPTGAAANLGLRLVLVPTDETTYTVNGVDFIMVNVEGGTFTMGSTNNFDEEPIHQVTLSPFAIGQVEVTQELWQAVMGSNPSHFNGDSYGTDLQRPVETVSWNDCQEFITELNKLTGMNFCLPTEAEWEYVARGGAKSKGYTYCGSNTLGDVAWYCDNSDYVSHDVGTKQANELGVYDMNGNVWEWCQDWYGDYSAEAQADPTGPFTGSERIQRGGSFEHETWAFPPTFRNAMSQNYKHKSVGLRLVLKR